MKHIVSHHCGAYSRTFVDSKHIQRGEQQRIVFIPFFQYIRANKIKVSKAFFAAVYSTAHETNNKEQQAND